jgi:hypothetical protein
MKAGTLLLLFAASAQAAQPDPSLRNFIACPIVRDTASVPCWLAEYDGELYFLTLQTDVSAPVNPPWLGHRVLVEGKRSDKARICGGIPLEPVRLSVIAESDASCNQLLPAEDRYNLTFEPPRPPGPSGGRLAFNTLPMPTQPAAVKKEPQHYTLDYYFDGMVNSRRCSTWPAPCLPRVWRSWATGLPRCCRMARCCRNSPTWRGVAPSRWLNC